MSKFYHILLLMILISTHSFGENPVINDTKKSKFRLTGFFENFMDWNFPWTMKNTESHQDQEVHERNVLEPKFFGDTKLFSSPNFNSIRKRFIMELQGKTDNVEELEATSAEYTKDLINQGYLLAHIQPYPEHSWSIVPKLKVHIGSFGKKKFFDISNEKRPFNEIAEEFRSSDNREKFFTSQGRFFSEKEIEKRLRFKEGEPFNYRQFYDQVLGLNQYRDLALHTLLDIRTEKKTDEHGDHYEQKIVDIDFFIKQSLPLYGEVTIDNTGTDETEEWRLSGTARYIRKNFNEVGLRLGSAFDGSLLFGGGNYKWTQLFDVPQVLAELYFSISNINVDDVFQSLDNEGDGWSLGSRVLIDLMSAPNFDLDLNLGFSHNFSKNKLQFEGNLLSDREIEVEPLRLGFNLSFSDRLWNGGYTLASASYVWNLGDRFGYDDREDFDEFRSDSESRYQLLRLQASRTQRLAGDPNGWLLYLKTDAQVSQDRLVSIEQKAIGGFSTVRGYKEREFLGDKGISGTVEVRAPKARIPKFFQHSENFFVTTFIHSWERVDYRFLTFFDFGHIKTVDPQPGEDKSTDLASLGVGLRLRTKERFQLWIDYGRVLEDEPSGIEVDGGRGHVVFQAQF